MSRGRGGRPGDRSERTGARRIAGAVARAGIAAGLGIGLAAAGPAPARAAFSVSGTVEVYASPTGPGPSRTTFLTDTAVRMSDGLSTSGSTGAGNSSEARFRADLWTGELAAYSRATNAFDPLPPPGHWLGATATSSAGFQDTLQFTVPAGSHPAGLQATLSGRTTGAIDIPVVPDVGATGGMSSWGVAFQRTVGGPHSFDSIARATGFLVAPNLYPEDEPFALEIDLVDPGTVLAAPAVVEAQITAYVGGPQANKVEVESQASATASANYEEDGLRLLSLAVPDGVSWTSASGVFLAPLCGDVNGDGRVTLLDAVLLLRSLLHPPTATLARPDLCDVNADGRCSIADAVVVRRSLLAPPTATIVPGCQP